MLIIQKIKDLKQAGVFSFFVVCLYFGSLN